MIRRQEQCDPRRRTPRLGASVVDRFEQEVERRCNVPGRTDLQRTMTARRRPTRERGGNRLRHHELERRVAGLQTMSDDPQVLSLLHYPRSHLVDAYDVTTLVQDDDAERQLIDRPDIR